MKGASPEEELARRVVEWMQMESWVVWQEVTPGPQAPVCDIVAKRGPVVWAVECKASPSLEVLEQARRWVERANYVSVAVPRRRSSALYQDFARSVGLGVLWVTDSGVTDCRGPFSREGRGRHRWYNPLRDFLTEQRRLWPAAAGNNRSERWTDFRHFCHGVRCVVEGTPGISVRNCVAEVKEHHYSSDASARSCLCTWTKAGKVEGVKLGWVGRTPVLWPAGWTDEMIDQRITDGIVHEDPDTRQLDLPEAVTR